MTFTMKSKGSNDSEIKDALLNKLREIGKQVLGGDYNV